MTGQQFEKDFCELLRHMGYWVLNIPRNASGAQPFDVIAVKGKEVFALDCKVCENNRFPLSRIEDNQWLAFNAIETKSEIACAGIAVLYDGEIFLITNDELGNAARSGKKSVNLNFKYPLWTENIIDDFLGKKLR